MRFCFRSLAVRVVAAWVLPALLVTCGTPTARKDPADGLGTVTPLVERAERLRARGDFDTAIAAYAEALERTPWNDGIRAALAASHADRASARRADGRLKDAEADLRRAFELVPDKAELRRNLAVVLLERAAQESSSERARALRAEAERLEPELARGVPVTNLSLERRLDLAFDLLQRGQLDVGLLRLEQLRRDFPGEPEVARLLAQALVRRASELSQRANHPEAGRALDRAVALYLEIPDCRSDSASACTREEVRIAHYNRIIAWLNATEPGPAGEALEVAERAGFAFPDLRAAVEKQRRWDP